MLYIKITGISDDYLYIVIKINNIERISTLQNNFNEEFIISTNYGNIEILLCNEDDDIISTNNVKYNSDKIQLIHFNNLSFEYGSMMLMPKQLYIKCITKADDLELEKEEIKEHILDFITIINKYVR